MTSPFDHPWLGALFGDDDASEIWSAERQLEHMLSFEAALTSAKGQIGLISPSDAEEMSLKIKAFKPNLNDLRVGTKRDGLVVPALVSQLKEMAGPDAVGIHTGATSQDVIDTTLSLTIGAFNVLLDARMQDLLIAFNNLSHKFGSRTIMGRTRMQAALPIKVEHRLRSWMQPIQNHVARLENLRPRIELLQLGGPVGDGSTLAPNTEKLSKIMAQSLGLGCPTHAWHTNRDNISEYANLLSLISGSVGKFGQDVCLMAQQNVNEIVLAGGGGSSAMAHKKNPILPELLVTLAQFNATQMSGIHQALIHEQERSGAAWALEWMILPQMAQTTARSLAAAKEVCETVDSIGSL